MKGDSSPLCGVMLTCRLSYLRPKLRWKLCRGERWGSKECWKTGIRDGTKSLGCLRFLGYRRE